MILISNGHFKFILGPAAHEIQKRGRLAGFITGGYPTERIQWLASRFGFAERKAVKRLLLRDEVLPESLIYPLWMSELIMQSSVWFLRFSGMSQLVDRMSKYAMCVYAYQAEKIVKKTKARIYHYRSGYGRKSVQIAKDKGMIALCDHSIAHPAVLDFLITNNGKLPQCKIDAPLNSMWQNVLQDIDQADYIVANSDFVKETFVNQGVEPKKIHVIYTGVDESFIDRIPNQSNDATDGYSMRLLFAGSLCKRKGGDILIQALEQINDLPWHLEIIANIDSDIASNYRSFLSSPQVKVSGLVPVSELPKRMSEAEIFIFPSLAEGSARVVFMALACGCYVITTPNSGSIIRNGVHGRLVPAGNVNALAGAIRQAMKDRDQLVTTGQRNAALIRTSYRQSHYGDNLIKLYDRLLDK